MKKYLDIINHYESCYKEHGDNFKGMDWPNLEDVNKRFNVMLDLPLFKKDFDKKSILDFGCGTAHLLEFIQKNKIVNFEYSGMDISKAFIQKANEKHPSNKFYCLDVLNPDNNFNEKFDYVVMNGVFTEKRSLSHDEMFTYFKKIIKLVFEKNTIKGIAFNVMSANVDWQREDLFHLSIDKLTQFLRKEISNNYIIRNDYGLFEYTTYIYK